MGSQVQAASRCRDLGPIFGEVAPEIIEDTLIHLATENEQYLSELSDQAGCFKETQIVGETLSQLQLTPEMVNSCIISFS